jgi:tetratricopeptide (TPR) repeat protein
MVSSTFLDLEKHRAELIKALQKEKIFGVGMENYVVNPADDVISSSLEMVRESSAYIGLISRRYGQIPKCNDRNPNAYSITQLEFEEAQRLKLPTLIFVMGSEHKVKEADIELDPKKREKLERFRILAKEGRIYVEFESLEHFAKEAIHAAAELARFLDEPAPSIATAVDDSLLGPGSDMSAPVPVPPAFYAEPSYMGSHKFIGRQSQLDTLNYWAAPADPHTILLFEAIGGTGKSILTWEWVTRYAADIRGDWAGRFWYSFYEKGAVMTDFCAHALAYMTGRPLKDFHKKKTRELGSLLLQHLKAEPWLLVLDGLERVLVAYHRSDAAQLLDEAAGTTDEMAARDPCAAIRPEDDELLFNLAGAAPSKILLTSRLTPRVLLNPAGQTIPGVLPQRLLGLLPPDAEALFRACGVTGDSKAIQDFLQRNCDCHPLVTGVLAGLVTNHFPDRGNFDAWVTDQNGGGQLNLADLDLVKKRNHILQFALGALDAKSHQLLSTLALLSEAIDYETLLAVNPHLPPKPRAMDEPSDPEDSMHWVDGERQQAKRDFAAALKSWKDYQEALAVRLKSADFLSAPQKLEKTVRNLERRGLLQYDNQSKRYDLHPVVRGYAAGKLEPAEKEVYGQLVVDHFSQKSHNPYAKAETLDDVRVGLSLVRTLLLIGRYQQAYDAYSGDLAEALKTNLGAWVEVLNLLRPFFPNGWDCLPANIDDSACAYVANDAAGALYLIDENEVSQKLVEAAMLLDLKSEDWLGVTTRLKNIALTLEDQGRLAKQEFCILLAMEFAAITENKTDKFRTCLDRFSQLTTIGQWEEAEKIWQHLDGMGRDWPRDLYHSGKAEYCYAKFRFQRGDLVESLIFDAEKLAREGLAHRTVVQVLGLRGEWQLQQGQFAEAEESFHEAVSRLNEVGLASMYIATNLALAKFHLGRLSSSSHEIDQLSKDPAHRALAELWFAMGDHEQAKKHALAAYRSACAVGEPYVYRYELGRARALLDKLGVEVPTPPPYDPDADEKLCWEDEVRATIQKLKQEKAVERRIEE